MKTKILSYILILSCILCSCADNFDNFYDNNKTSSDNDTEHSTPGVVITFSPSHTRNYVASPSIAILDNGTYIASHDWQQGGFTSVFQSVDKGATWEKVSDVPNMHWANLFVHNGDLYLMGVNKSFGNIHIRKSTDAGSTWTNPTSGSDGVLFTDGQYHTAPVPVAIHNGRIWRSFEDAQGNTGDRNFKTLVISADVNSDLLNSSNWTASNKLAYNEDWGGTEWIEGNVVVTPDNNIVNILRNNSKSGERAVKVRVQDASTITFDNTTDFITFPGSNVKFSIRYDESSGRYWSLSNYIPDEFTIINPNNPEATRNTLALVSSRDLINWEVNKIILQSQDVKRAGYQYADWQIEGDDIVSVLRVAHPEPDGTDANNFHDANYILFYRVANFRNASGPVEPGVNFDDMDIRVIGNEDASFAVSSFANDASFFTDRDYKLENIPEPLNGYSFLSSKANVIDKGVIVPSRDGYVYILAQKRTDGKLDDWTLEPDVEFNYNDYNKTKLYVFKKSVTAGQRIPIPELDGFPGASPLAKKITYSVGEIPTPGVDEMSIAVAGANGATFELKDFKNGSPIFTNRDFVLENVPEQFKDFKFLSSDGNVIDKGTIVPSRDGYVYIIAQKRTDGKLAGWALDSDDIEFNYNDGNKTKLYIFKKGVTAGEQVTIPDLDGFPGASPLAKTVNYTAN